MQHFQQLLLLLLLGLLLLWAIIFYAQAWRDTFGEPKIWIAPIEGITDLSGTTISTDSGEALAGMLRSRLLHLKNEINQSQQALTAGRESDRLSLLPISDIHLPERVFRPLAFDLKVRGVDAGPFLQKMQRVLASTRMLTISFVANGEQATVSGHADWKRGAQINFWVSTPNNPEAIIDHAAHALIRAMLEADENRHISSLSDSEFRDLVTSMRLMARSNRLEQSGSKMDRESWMEVIGPLSSVLAKTPSWNEIKALTARALFNADFPDESYRLYEELRAASDLSPELKSQIDAEFSSFFPTSITPMELLAPDGLSGFRRRVDEFAQRVGLQTVKRIDLRKSLPDDVPASWDDKEGQYLINSQHLSTIGLDRYIASMGRFFERHSKDCAEIINGQDSAWNEVRKTLVYILLQSDEMEDREIPILRPAEIRGYRLYRTLDEFARLAALDRRKRQELSVILIEKYQCHWTSDDLGHDLLKILSVHLQPSEVEKLKVACRWYYGGENEEA